MKLVFLLLFIILPFYCYPGPYTSSAHGNSTYGVKRNVVELSGYSQGNCAHCHEQHASINGTEPDPTGGPDPFCLFSKNFNTDLTTRPDTGYTRSSNFCFYCHTATNSLQSGGITNYNYSRTFGGYTGSSVEGILDAFNQSGSYHNLYDIWSFAKDNFSWFKEDSNPCVACHNPHRARRNKEHPSDPSYTAISRPVDHESLWGDDIDERMSNYTYQAPYYYNETSYYEPGKTTITDGSNLPNYNTFCLDCHSSNVPSQIWSTGGTNQLRSIDWSINGDKHGQRDADGGIDINDPYSSSSLGYVLSCTDCHEPHGSPSIMLIREEVNGGELSSSISSYHSDQWRDLCSRCHNSNMRYVHHTSQDAPYKDSCYKQCGCCHGGNPESNPISCEKCHFHGGDDSWLQNTSKSYCVTGRRCF